MGRWPRREPEIRSGGKRGKDRVGRSNRARVLACAGATLSAGAAAATAERADEAGAPSAATVVETVTVTETTTVFAKRFGERGVISLGAERLAGLVWTINVSDSPMTWRGSVALLGQSFVASTPLSLIPQAQPRFAMDWFFVERLSFGGTFTAAYSRPGGDGTTAKEADRTTLVGLGVAPRFGYALAIIDWITLWGNVGIQFNYARAGTDGAPETQWMALALSVEPMFLFEIGPQFGITATPNVDIPLLSKQKAGTASYRDQSKMLTTGLSLGLTTWF